MAPSVPIWKRLILNRFTSLSTGCPLAEMHHPRCISCGRGRSPWTAADALVGAQPYTRSSSLVGRNSCRLAGRTIGSDADEGVRSARSYAAYFRLTSLACRPASPERSHHRCHESQSRQKSAPVHAGWPVLKFDLVLAAIHHHFPQRAVRLINPCRVPIDARLPTRIESLAHNDHPPARHFCLNPHHRFAPFEQSHFIVSGAAFQSASRRRGCVPNPGTTSSRTAPRQKCVAMKYT